MQPPSGRIATTCHPQPRICHDRQRHPSDAVSGRVALPEFIVRCDVTGDTLLREEAWTSDVSGRVARIALFKKSPVSGRKGLEDEFDTCEVTAIARVIE